jgi:hypothetical protein
MLMLVPDDPGRLGALISAVNIFVYYVLRIATGL